RFDCVVLDYMLPDGTGLDLIPIIRASAPETPVLFLTAHGSEDVALKALSLGASDYMQKDGALFAEFPLRVDALLARSGDVAKAGRVGTVHITPHEGHGQGQGHGSTRVTPDKDAMAHLLGEVVKGDVVGAAVFDGSGKPIAALLPMGTDASRLGAAAFELHA